MEYPEDDDRKEHNEQPEKCNKGTSFIPFIFVLWIICGIITVIVAHACLPLSTFTENIIAIILIILFWPAWAVYYIFSEKYCSRNPKWEEIIPMKSTTPAST
jgi:hypothetical protein